MKQPGIQKKYICCSVWLLVFICLEFVLHTKSITDAHVMDYQIVHMMVDTQDDSNDRMIYVLSLVDSNLFATFQL